MRAADTNKEKGIVSELRCIIRKVSVDPQHLLGPFVFLLSILTGICGGWLILEGCSVLWVFGLILFLASGVFVFWGYACAGGIVC